MRRSCLSGFLMGLENCRKTSWPLYNFYTLNEGFSTYSVFSSADEALVLLPVEINWKTPFSLCFQCTGRSGKLTYILHTYFIVTSPMGLFRNNYLSLQLLKTSSQPNHTEWSSKSQTSLGYSTCLRFRRLASGLGLLVTRWWRRWGWWWRTSAGCGWWVCLSLAAGWFSSRWFAWAFCGLREGSFCLL